MKSAEVPSIKEVSCRKCLGNHLWPHRWFCLLRSQLRTGTVSRLFWITPTRCTSSLNQVCIQCSCQKHQWVRISLLAPPLTALYETGSTNCWLIVLFWYFLSTVEHKSETGKTHRADVWALQHSCLLPLQIRCAVCVSFTALFPPRKCELACCKMLNISNTSKYCLLYPWAAFPSLWVFQFCKWAIDRFGLRQWSHTHHSYSSTWWLCPAAR